MFLPVTIAAEHREVAAKAPEDHKKLLTNCLSGIMVLGQNKQVIKKLDLNKIIYSGLPRSQHHTITKAVLAFANHDLNKYMGMRLFELEDNKGYLLVNNSYELSQYRKEFTKEQCDEVAVIHMVLMQIFTSADESATEKQVRDTLEILDLSRDENEKHFSMLQKKLYIVPVPQGGGSANPDGEKLFKWGPRAKAEVDPDRFMSSFLSLAHDGNPPDKDWPEQERRANNLKAIPNR